MRNETSAPNAAPRRAARLKGLCRARAAAAVARSGRKSITRGHDHRFCLWCCANLALASSTAGPSGQRRRLWHQGAAVPARRPRPKPAADECGAKSDHAERKTTSASQVHLRLVCSLNRSDRANPGRCRQSLVCSKHSQPAWRQQGALGVGEPPARRQNGPAGAKFECVRVIRADRAHDSLLIGALFTRALPIRAPLVCMCDIHLLQTMRAQNAPEQWPPVAARRPILADCRANARSGQLQSGPALRPFALRKA